APTDVDLKDLRALTRSIFDRSLTPTPATGAPTTRRRPRRKDQDRELAGLPDPAPLPSGMTCGNTPGEARRLRTPDGSRRAFSHGYLMGRSWSVRRPYAAHSWVETPASPANLVSDVGPSCAPKLRQTSAPSSSIPRCRASRTVPAGRSQSNSQRRAAPFPPAPPAAADLRRGLARSPTRPTRPDRPGRRRRPARSTPPGCSR
ncbi:MAG: hypothetical protein QOE59_5357, partial [Actinomycetota bacterium]|nr:hypothetical protein [Actinomycetota bacterium]